MVGSVRDRVADSGSEPGASLDVFFGLLADRRCRFVLYYQSNRRRPVPLEELVESVAAWERELDDIDEVDEAGIRRQLHEAHLPRIREAGLIEYDKELELAEYVCELSVIEPVLDSARRREWAGRETSRSSGSASPAEHEDR